MTNLKITLDDRGGWKRGGRIANAATYRKTCYDITLDGNRIGHMKEDYDGCTDHKGWIAYVLHYPAIRTDTVKVVPAKAEIKKIIKGLLTK